MKKAEFPWPVAVIRSSRRTVSVEISRDGNVILRVPSRFPASGVPAFLYEKSEWIDKNLAAWKERNAAVVPYTEEEVRDLFRRAKEILPARVRFYADRMGVGFYRITIRNQRTRWGSCTSRGNLNFNCVLADPEMPEAVLDYVVVHELSHRLEMNHSPRFWAQVEKTMPDYRERRLWLKRNGERFLCRMFASADENRENGEI